MTTVLPFGGVQSSGAWTLGWVEGALRDGLRTERVRAHLLHRVVDADPEECHLEGEFDPLPALAVGKAVRLELDDGRSSLVVMVSRAGRFHTVGPLT